MKRFFLSGLYPGGMFAVYASFIGCIAGKEAFSVGGKKTVSGMAAGAL